MNKLNHHCLTKFAAVTAVSGFLFLSGNAVADAAKVTDSDMRAFREAYVAQSPAARIFKQDITLFSTNFHLDIDSEMQVLKDGALRMGGQFNWTYTNLKSNFTTKNVTPFYIEQIGNKMTLYVKRAGKWSKMLLPGFPSGIAILWKSTDPVILDQIMDAVKFVETLKDTPDLRTMNVTLDGIKIANILVKNSSATFANLSGDALDEQKKIFNRWLSAFRKNDITFTWTVNKPSWTTATVIFDLTPIMRAYAIHVLNESAAGRIVLTAEERDLLDAIGYYSELKTYSTQIAPRKDTMINPPAGLSEIPENENALNDIFSEMTTVVK